MHWRGLEECAARLAAAGRGLLAMDESTGTMGKRLAAIGLENTEEARRSWRGVLLGAQEALRAHISGAILFDETLRQKTADGKALSSLAEEAGVLPGIKVDKGAKPLPFHEGETITEGLDGLRERLQDYRALGARFAKWRAVLSVGEGMPSRAALRANAHALARYAALCQEAGLVPVVEPELLMDGVHNIIRCQEASEAMLRAVYDELAGQNVRLEATILKPNMITSGAQCEVQAGVEEVAARTLACLKRTVPLAVAGIAFLSGGQSEEQASAHLSAINQSGSHAWPLTFSYGRALQASALKIWGGREENVEAARAAFAHRARMNSLAAAGQWRPELEQAAA